MTNVVNQLVDSEKNAVTTNQSWKGLDTSDLSSLTAYILEALSSWFILLDLLLLTSNSGIDPPFTGVYRVAKRDETIVSLTVKQGERLFLDVAAANMNVSGCAMFCTSLRHEI